MSALLASLSARTSCRNSAAQEHVSVLVCTPPMVRHRQAVLTFDRSKLGSFAVMGLLSRLLRPVLGTFLFVLLVNWLCCLELRCQV